MTSKKKLALITGINGQDGFYLAKLLLSKDYVVVGIQRRTSSPTNWRLSDLPTELLPNLHLESGDVTDFSSLLSIVNKYQPDEFYNLAAQSHVWHSFKSPLSTLQITGMGAANCLEAIRQAAPHCRFYQAGSSEQFGNSALKKGQDDMVILNEDSLMHPRSPYGVAKQMAYDFTRNYREAYGLFAVAGLLFNHESVVKETTLLVKQNNKIDVVRIKDMVGDDPNRATWLPSRHTEIWDGENWTKLNMITTRPVREDDKNQDIRVVNTRNGIVKPTNHHNMLNEFGEKRRNDTLEIGDRLLHGKYPTPVHLNDKVTVEEAELIGIIAGDGWVAHNNDHFSISNTNSDVQAHIIYLWKSISGKETAFSKKQKSGFGGVSQQIKLYNPSWITSLNLRDELYNSDKEKKVPSFILNGSQAVQYAFLKGYNMADGLKANKCTYEFKNFKTNSGHLAQGLLYLIAQVTGQNWNVTYEIKEDGRTFYSINLLSPNSNINPEKGQIVQQMLDQNIPLRQIARETGYSRGFVQKIARGESACTIHHLAKSSNEIKKVHLEQTDWVADLNVDSGKIMAGIGTIVIANSPYRGEEFVTRKITKGIASVLAGKQEILKLGNVSACRDWGHAEDYMRAAWLMLQQDNPYDYVIATGETYSVKQFLEKACLYAGVSDPSSIIQVDEDLYRPSEIHVLIGDARKAYTKLGWEPVYTFDGLVYQMVSRDLARYDVISRLRE